MSLPKAYLTSIKNLDGILNAIRGAQAPERFTQLFLESLEFKSSSDRLIIPILKFLGFLDPDGKPQERYFNYLDQTQSETIMAEAIREAYSDLFQIKTDAQSLTRSDLKNKFRTLSQGKLKDAVLDKMAMTFTALVSKADFTKPISQSEHTSNAAQDVTNDSANAEPNGEPKHKGALFGGLHYNIQIMLPATRDTKIYDAIFKSLKEHLSDR